MQVLTLTTLYPNAEMPNHCLFVEHRIRHISREPDVKVTVLAPVPWFPLRSARFGQWARFARVPAQETRHALAVHHPRFLSIPKVGMTLAPLLMALCLWPSVRRLHRAQRFDVIDAHYLYPDTVAAVLLGRWLGIPVVGTARGSDVNRIAPHRGPRRWLNWALPKLQQLITVSQALHDRLRALHFPLPAHALIRNGVDTQQFQPEQAQPTWRAALPAGQPVLLAVGNLVSEKGFALALDTLAALPNMQLVIIGDGPEKLSLQQQADRLQIGDRMHWLGRRPQAELAAAYAHSDLLLLTSHSEGMPNVVLEALACGLPVVATAVGGVPEWLALPFGRCVDSRDPARFANAVREQLALSAMARSAARAAVSDCDWQKTAATHVHCLQAACRKAALPEPAHA
jgi:teichuronic acid biosynthesis glycosyltransferase TuaC